MEKIELVKNRLIDRILLVDNSSFLEAIEEIIIANQKNNYLKLSDSQKKMLQLSEDDIKYGRLISEEELDENDKEWID